jgi:pyruvate dehydrogenase E1 component alpha subunit
VFAQSVRDTLNAEPELDPLSLFDHVYAEPTRQLQRQRAALAAELEA